MIAVSACLAGENCKYSGGNNLVESIKELVDSGKAITVCPEVEGGLPIPRPSAEIQADKVINTEGTDVTEAYVKGAEICLEKVKKAHCSLCILKSNSPSCGIGEIYDGTFTHTRIKGDGVFAKLLKEQQIPVMRDTEKRETSMDYGKEALRVHAQNHGKLSVEAKVPCADATDLSIAYTPGVAAPCMEIHRDPELAYTYTDRGNTVAVVTDGTAVLGLGDIGPEAALPVMEGKALLMKKFAGLDAWPICLNTKDPDEIVSIVKAIAPGFGAVNLEDISAPRCVEIERRLIEECPIPVFHDDQHGTAIVVTAALINCMKLKGANPSSQKVVISGCGAAGSSIIRMLYNYGFTKIYAFDIDGCVDPDYSENYNALKKELLQFVNLDHQHYASLAEALKGADIFIGVSAPHLLNKEMVASMSEKNIVFSMANPIPEISYEEAKEAGAWVIGTGRSDYPNQVNNLLAFPGLFRGALDAKATKITEEMKLAAAKGLASLVSDEELTTEHVIVSPFDQRVVPTVAEAVAKEAIRLGVVRK